jgi:hypothetical protein
MPQPNAARTDRAAADMSDGYLPGPHMNAGRPLRRECDNRPAPDIGPVHSHGVITMTERTRHENRDGRMIALFRATPGNGRNGNVRHSTKSTMSRQLTMPLLYLVGTMKAMMTSGRTIWVDQLDAEEVSPLDPGLPEALERRPDVLVVGGGIIGVATAAACRDAGVGSVLL